MDCEAPVAAAALRFRARASTRVAAPRWAKGAKKLDGAQPRARREVPAEQHSVTVVVGTDPIECSGAPVVETREVPDDAGAGAAQNGGPHSMAAGQGPRACSAPSAPHSRARNLPAELGSIPRPSPAACRRLRSCSAGMVAEAGPIWSLNFGPQAQPP